MLQRRDDGGESTGDQERCAVELADSSQEGTQVDERGETIHKLYDDVTIGSPVYQFDSQPEGEGTDQI